MTAIRAFTLALVAFLSPISAILTLAFIAIVSLLNWRRNRYVGTTWRQRRAFERHLRQREAELVAAGR